MTAPKQPKTDANKPSTPAPAKAANAAKGAQAANAAKAAQAAKAAAEPYARNLDYLEDELIWIEQRTRRLGLERKLAAASGEDEDTPQVRRGHDEPSPRVLRARIRGLQATEDAVRTRIDRRLAQQSAAEPLAIDRLVALHGLDAFERTVLLLAAAPCFSRRFEEMFGEIDRQGFSSCLTVEVVFEFCGLSFSDRVDKRKRFASSSALVSNDLVTVDFGRRYSGPKELLCTDVDITARAYAALLGDDRLPDDFADFSSVEVPKVHLEQVVIDADDKQRILSVVERHDRYLACRRDWGFDDIIRYGRGVLMLFHGKPGTGKTMMAHAVADHLGKRVLNVDIPTFVDHAEAMRFLPGLFREARMQDAILFFDECEALFASRRQGNALMTLLLTEIERFEGVAILATNLPELLDEALDRRILVKVQFPEPDREARREIWRRHLPEKAPLADDVDLDFLADRFQMSGGYIKNAVLMAVAHAVHSNGDKPTITMAIIEKAARDQLRRPQGEQSDLVIPKVRLADVILPADVSAQVADLVAAARNRRTLLERWGVGSHLTYGKGVSALLHGEPGTGKTLSAEAIASELGRPLMVAAIPGIVSKWVGETERNLSHLFKNARQQGAVLFLDEADTLLMARGEGRASRHDDAAVNVLLQLIERHEGVVLLATNRAVSLDPALTRRLTERIRFPMPDATLRAAIWRRLLPETVPKQGELDFARLGARFELAGGGIKNAVFKAAFRAANGGGVVTMALLEAAALQETGGIDGEVRRPVGFARAG